MLDLRTALAACVCWIGLAATTSADNFMNLVLTRSDDYRYPADQFSASLEVNLPDVPGVSAVSISVAGGGSFSLEGDESETWHVHGRYADLAAMKAELDGQWTISIVGSQPSTSTFTLQADLLQDANFFATASGLNPPHNSLGVPSGTSLSWTPPAGAASALGVFVNIDSDNNYQDDNSVLGTLDASATSWDPPQHLSNGENQFTVGYYVIDSSFITALSVTSGSMLWGDSPYAPSGYPANTPLLPLGSETTIAFDVVPEPSTFVLLSCGAVGLALWEFGSRRRRRSA